MTPLLIASLMVVSLNSPSSIEDYIIARATKYGYPVAKAVAIAKCESGLIPTAKNPSSTAQGVYQFINSTWYGVMDNMGLPTTTSKTNPYYNIEAGIYLLNKDGDRHWSESKPCWQPKYLSTLSEN